MQQAVNNADEYLEILISSVEVRTVVISPAPSPAAATIKFLEVVSLEISSTEAATLNVFFLNLLSTKLAEIYK